MGGVWLRRWRGDKVATDNQYSTPLLACDPKIRGTAICHTNGKCSQCGFAQKYENPEEVPFIFFKGLIERAKEAEKTWNSLKKSAPDGKPSKKHIHETKQRSKESKK